MNLKDFLLIGHITRDIAPNGEFIPGGPVTYAGITLALRGHNVQILTKAAQNDPLLDFIRSYGINISNLSSTEQADTTTYTNIYDEFQNRTQFISAVGELFAQRDLAHITELAKGKRTMILPVANEIPSTFYQPLSKNAELLIAAPQGSLRRWDENGRVFHEPFTPEYLDALTHANITTISNEDMEGFSEEMRYQILHQTSDTVILTNGRDGAHMYHDFEVSDVPPFRLDYESEEKGGYPTGNGDHMTAVIAEGAPPFAEKLLDPFQYQEDMYTAVAKGAFLTALKIIKRDGVEDGIGSIWQPADIAHWSKQNIDRIYTYADICNLDLDVFLEGKQHNQQEGNTNSFYRR